MRPIDELPDAAEFTLMRNAAMTWLRDAAGIDYALPSWLVTAIGQAWDLGYAEAQSDMREALGFVETPPENCECAECRQGESGKKEAGHG